MSAGVTELGARALARLAELGAGDRPILAAEDPAINARALMALERSGHVEVLDGGLVRLTDKGREAADA